MGRLDRSRSRSRQVGCAGGAAKQHGHSDAKHKPLHPILHYGRRLLLIPCLHVSPSRNRPVASKIHFGGGLGRFVAPTVDPIRQEKVTFAELSINIVAWISVPNKAD